MSKRRLTPEEARAWDRVRKSVRPLKGEKSPRIKRDVSDQGLLNTAPPAPEKPVTSKKTPTGPSLDHGRTVSTPPDRGTERRIKRGKVDISARFDLHGHTQASAWSALPAFLMREQARGSRCVIVITGKGRLGEGVLRRNFLRWLEMPQARGLVSGYAQAHPRHGGAGAFYVFLKRR